MWTYPIDIADVSLIARRLDPAKGHSYDGRTLTVVDEAESAIVDQLLADIDTHRLEAARALAQAAVNAKRDAIVAGGYHHNFGNNAGIRTLDQRGATDETAWLTVKLLAMDAIAAGAGGSEIAMRDASNETFLTTANTASAAISSMGLWRSAVSANSWAMKDAITAAETLDELAAIDIDSGWPE